MSRFSYGWRVAKQRQRRYAIQSFLRMIKLEQKQTTGLTKSPMVSGMYNS